MEEIAVKLKELGIGSFEEQMLQELQSKWEQVPEELKASMNKTTWLLDAAGMGNYDYETWTYTPSSEDVYAFDVEVFNEGAMYTDFLKGISAIGRGDLDFTEVEEDLENVDWEAGTGRRSITFLWKGERYSLEAEVMGDWFDLGVANQLNQIIMERQEGKRLYFGSDGYQNVYVFYRDADWADAFARAVGMELVETLR